MKGQTKAQMAALKSSLAASEADLAVAEALPATSLARGHEPAIVARPLVEPRVERSIAVVERPGRSPSPAAVALRALAIEALRALFAPEDVQEPGSPDRDPPKEAMT